MNLKTISKINSVIIPLIGTLILSGWLFDIIAFYALIPVFFLIIAIAWNIFHLRNIDNMRSIAENVIKQKEEELQAKVDYIKNNEERVNTLLEVLLKYTSLDFSKKAPISDKGDELDAFAAGINTLVEELEYNLQQIKENEERFRMLTENVKDYAIFSIDTQGNITSWNKGAEHIKGYTAEEIIGKNISIFYTQEEIQRQEPENNLKSAEENGQFKTESLRIRKDGSLFWADILFSSVYDAEGNLTGFTKISRDITERKKTELELETKSRELVRSNTELEQFAYVASHDLQEPLRMVNSYVQLLANRYKDKLDQDANDFINFAVDGSNRMRNLINSLLEYSRVNRIRPFEWIDVNLLLNEVSNNLDKQIKDNNALIKWGEMPKTYGDRTLIGLLFQNLISNAIKFHGDKNPEIFISGKKSNNEYLFSVKDSGIGIQKEYMEKIFVIFQRLHAKDKYPGTGIGLAICKKIVEKHGGKIWLKSEINKGTTFYFTLKANDGKQL